MIIDKETVEKVANLARLELAADEKEAMIQDMKTNPSNILHIGSDEQSHYLTPKRYKIDAAMYVKQPAAKENDIKKTALIEGVKKAVRRQNLIYCRSTCSTRCW